MKTEYKWINMTKLAAILGVVAIHMYGTLYLKAEYIYALTVSVSLFVIVTGFSTFLSYERNNEKIWKKVFVKVRNIFVPYLVATFIYYAFSTDIFRVQEYLHHVVHCTAFGLFYYVSVYIQLTIISPIIYKYISEAKKKRLTWLRVLLGFAVVALVSYYTNQYTDVLEIYAGGGKLFGGTFLVIYYVGMCIGSFLPDIKIKNFINVIGMAICSVGFIAFGWFLINYPLVLDRYLPFGNGFNPPSISYLIYSIIIFFFFFFFEKVLDLIPVEFLKKTYSTISKLGKHTLFVFMYHMFICEHILKKLNEFGIEIKILWIKKIVYFIAMFAISLLIEKIYMKIKEYIK